MASSILEEDQSWRTDVAIREHPTDTGSADDVLFVDCKVIGLNEAKKDGTILTFP